MDHKMWKGIFSSSSFRWEKKTLVSNVCAYSSLTLQTLYSSFLFFFFEFFSSYIESTKYIIGKVREKTLAASFLSNITSARTEVSQTFLHLPSHISFSWRRSFKKIKKGKKISPLATERWRALRKHIQPKILRIFIEHI